MAEFIKLNIEKNGNPIKLSSILIFYSPISSFFRKLIVTKNIKSTIECLKPLAPDLLINAEVTIKKLLKDLGPLIIFVNYSRPRLNIPNILSKLNFPKKASQMTKNLVHQKVKTNSKMKKLALKI